MGEVRVKDGRGDTLHLRLPDGRPILFWVLVLVGACQSGTVWAGLCLIHHHQSTEVARFGLPTMVFLVCVPPSIGWLAPPQSSVVLQKTKTKTEKALKARW